MSEVATMLGYRYENLGFLGEGFSGEVFKAKDRQTNSIVAIKRILQREGKTKEEVNNQMSMEIWALSSIKHKNVLQLFDVCNPLNTEENYLVLEYCSTDMFYMVMENEEPISLDQRQDLIRQLFEGLQEIHRRNIIHRDIKLENLLLQGDILKIADFGSCARKFPLKKESIEGTIKCMAPELLLGVLKYKDEIDIWAAGIAAFEISSRRNLLLSATRIGLLKEMTSIFGAISNDTLPGMKLDSSISLNDLDATQERKFYSLCEGIIRNDFLMNLLDGVFSINPLHRPSANELLKHPFFIFQPVLHTYTTLDGNMSLAVDMMSPPWKQEAPHTSPEPTALQTNDPELVMRDVDVILDSYVQNIACPDTQIFGAQPQAAVMETSPYCLHQPRAQEVNTVHNIPSMGSGNRSFPPRYPATSRNVFESTAQNILELSQEPSVWERSKAGEVQLYFRNSNSSSKENRPHQRVRILASVKCQ